MKHHRTGTGDNDPDGTFCHTVLPFGAYTAKTYGLGVSVNFMDEALAFEDSVVSVVGVDSDAMEECHTFETVFGKNSIGGIEGYLRLSMKVAGGGITKYHGSAELLGILLMASGVEETTSDPRLEVINKDAITWAKLVDEEVALMIRTLGGGGCVVRTTGLLSILASRAKGLFQGFGVSEPKSKVVEEAPNAKTLDMGERQMAEFDMPLHPQFLKCGEIGVRRM
jgi:hypothetical protein